MIESILILVFVLMTVDEALAELGLKNDSRLAEYFDINPSNITDWRNAGKIPPARELHIIKKRLDVDKPVKKKKRSTSV